MIFNMVGRGGGAGLNFEIVGGTTQPTSPKENTIWINTGTEITGWAFGESEPTSPNNGFVWFPTGTASESMADFQALKKNSIMVYPLSAKQYVDGAWVFVPAQSYKNGLWSIWFDGYLYKSGDECTDVTGGWENVDYPGYSSGSIVKGSSTINLKTDSTPQVTAIKPVNKINFTNFNTVHVKFTKNELIGSAKTYIAVAPVLDGTDIRARLSVSGTGTKTLDVSSVSGEYYLYIYAMRPNSSSDFDVIFNEVKLS